MQIVTIHDAKTNLSKYIAAVKAGKKVLIGGFGKPEVKLVKISPTDLAESKTRDFSCAQHKVIEHTDSFSKKTEKMVQDVLIGK